MKKLIAKTIARFASNALLAEITAAAYNKQDKVPLPLDIAFVRREVSNVVVGLDSRAVESMIIGNTAMNRGNIAKMATDILAEICVQSALLMAGKGTPEAAAQNINAAIEAVMPVKDHATVKVLDEGDDPDFTKPEAYTKPILH